MTWKCTTGISPAAELDTKIPELRGSGIFCPRAPEFTPSARRGFAPSSLYLRRANAGHASLLQGTSARSRAGRGWTTMPELTNESLTTSAKDSLTGPPAQALSGTETRLAQPAASSRYHRLSSPSQTSHPPVFCGNLHTCARAMGRLKRNGVLTQQPNPKEIRSCKFQFASIKNPRTLDFETASHSLASRTRSMSSSIHKPVMSSLTGSAFNCVRFSEPSRYHDQHHPKVSRGARQELAGHFLSDVGNR